MVKIDVTKQELFNMYMAMDIFKRTTLYDEYISTKESFNETYKLVGYTWEHYKNLLCDQVDLSKKDMTNILMAMNIFENSGQFDEHVTKKENFRDTYKWIKYLRKNYGDILPLQNTQNVNKHSVDNDMSKGDLP